MKTVGVLLFALSVTSAAAAQDPLELAKTQYAAAAYEDALATLAGVGDPPRVNRLELEQYRAFCLIALNRMPDAERAVAAIAEVDPTYVPSRAVASPKVLSLVAEMRKAALPGVAVRLLEEGRTAFEEKALGRAQRNFNLLLGILDEEGMRGRPESQALRTVAEGFLALAEAATAPAEPPAPAAPEPAVVSTPVRVGILPPEPVLQQMPSWVPPDPDSGARGYKGLLKIRIGADGRVTEASIEEPTHPLYDARLLQAARHWLYKPATRDGEPVESEKQIAVQLHPRQ